jgi:hypothetical protein
MYCCFYKAPFLSFLDVLFGGFESVRLFFSNVDVLFCPVATRTRSICMVVPRKLHLGYLTWRSEA